VDTSGALYVAETNRIRKVTATTITTLAGGGSGPDGENIAAASTSVNATYIALDNQGNILHVDGNRVRRVSFDDKVATVAGLPTTYASFTGDGGPALAATLNRPEGLAVDSHGNIAVADTFNGRIRLLTPVYNTCNYTLSGNNLMLSGAAGTANVTVSTTPACAWNTMSNAPWITVTNSGVGTGTATITYTYNSVTARTGTIYIAGQPVTVTQSAGSGRPTPGLPKSASCRLPPAIGPSMPTAMVVGTRAIATSPSPPPLVTSQSSVTGPATEKPRPVSTATVSGSST